MLHSLSLVIGVPPLHVAKLRVSVDVPSQTQTTANPFRYGLVMTRKEAFAVSRTYSSVDASNSSCESLTRSADTPG